MLSTISEIILNKSRTTDFFGRYGGEEFLLILTETNLQSAFEAVEPLRKLVENHDFSPVGNMTISCGIAEMNSEIQNIKDLLKVSDDNLYKAKNSGRNCIIPL